MPADPLAHWRDRRWALVSTSPTRLSVLRRAGIEPEIFPPGSDERTDPSLPLEEAVLQIARDKLASVRVPADFVALACDTLVRCGGEVLGKPGDELEARRMLDLQARVGEQEILTGVVVATAGRSRSGLARARVKSLVPAPAGAWGNFAGGMNYEEGDPRFVLVEGTLEDVWGMPLALVARLLAELEA